MFYSLLFLTVLSLNISPQKKVRNAPFFQQIKYLCSNVYQQRFVTEDLLNGSLVLSSVVVK